jgi:hypothetical protein
MLLSIFFELPFANANAVINQTIDRRITLSDQLIERSRLSSS